MQKIAPDFTRMIDLPGVGPCPRPVDIDQSVTGFGDLVSLRIYSFSGPAAINGEAEDDEVLIVLLDGAASIGVTGQHRADYELTTEGTRAIYLPPGHHYRLTPNGSATVAYARAKPAKTKAPQDFAVGDDGLVIEDYADRLQLRLISLDGAEAVPATTSAGPDVERLVHALGGENTFVDSNLPPWQTIALSRSEMLGIKARGEVLIVSAS